MTIAIRALREDDVAGAERVRRLAFGTMLGLPDPLSFRGDAALLGARRWACPEGALIASEGEKILGIAMANRWGSLGFFGPVAVDPEQWRRGIARQLLEAAMPVFARWDNRLVGLFTFPERPAHIRLYQSFGFWPRALTAIMARPITGPSAVSDALSLGASSSPRDLIAQCATLADGIYPGLDLSREIEAVTHLGLGDTVLLSSGSRITGFAICHHGAGSEGGSSAVYVKFAAVERGAEAPARLTRLLAACGDLAYRRGATELSAGVNLGRMSAYRLLIDRGFRSVMQGVAMHRPWAEAYDRDDVFALDDWR